MRMPPMRVEADHAGIEDTGRAPLKVQAEGRDAEDRDHDRKEDQVGDRGPSLLTSSALTPKQALRAEVEDENEASGTERRPCSLPG